MNINDLTDEKREQYLRRCGHCTATVDDGLCMMPTPCYYHDHDAWVERYKEKDIRYRKHFVDCVTE